MMNRFFLMSLFVFITFIPAHAEAIDFPEELRGKYSSDANTCNSLVEEMKKGNGWLGNLEINEKGVTYDNGTNCIPTKVIKLNGSYKIHSQCSGEQDYEEDATYTVGNRMLNLKLSDYENKYALCTK